MVQCLEFGRLKGVQHMTENSPIVTTRTLASGITQIDLPPKNSAHIFTGCVTVRAHSQVHCNI
jgi:hypothetical protein